MSIHCYAAFGAGEPLRPHTYEPENLGPFDVEITITHCGICHSDVHLIDNDWQISAYPLVPGHEIIGTMRAVGSQATRFAVGQRVGVGWQCGSCLECEWCLAGKETCCAKQRATCVGRPGGFAEAVRVDSRFVFAIPEGLASRDAAPLLCAGITVYTPLRSAKPWSRVGVIGIGGLGHMAIQFANAMGCEVTAFSTAADKAEEARRLGAHHFVATRDAAVMMRAVGSLDLLLSTATAKLNWGEWFGLLRPEGTLCIVGASPGTLDIPTMAMILGQKSVRGSVIGNRSAIEEMLRFAALHGITARTEAFPMSEVNMAVDRVRKSQARYRVVLEN